MNTVLRFVRRAWLRYRIWCAEDELEHMWECGCRGSHYIVNTLEHLAELRTQLESL